MKGLALRLLEKDRSVSGQTKVGVLSLRTSEPAYGRRMRLAIASEREEVVQSQPALLAGHGAHMDPIAWEARG